MGLEKIRPLYSNYKITIGLIRSRFYIHYNLLLFKIFLAVRLLSLFKPEINYRLVKIRLLVLSSTVFILLSLATAFLFWKYILKDLPKPESLVNRNIALTSKIYDRHGELLYSIYKDENRTLVTLENVPLYVRYATLAAEDANFYKHKGFSVKGISRAIVKYLQEGKVTGGSTITQQLVKNALLSSEKTLVRKLKEVIVAIEVEQKFSKDQILEMYLNEVSYGGTAFGIEEASKLYFNKDVGKLTLSEAALLAGLPKSPTLLSPFGTTPELANNRKNQILDLMYENNFISKEVAERSKNEPVNFAPNTINMKAPHFVMYVKEILAQLYGENYLEKGGLTVRTTLDMNIQSIAQDSLKEELKKIKHLNVTNGAALVLNSKTGEILAMVGSSDYFDKDNDGNVNVLLRPRQPGSSIKVINYAYALTNGLTPATILDDSPTVFNVDGQEPYIPKNYDGKYRGKLTLRNALAESRNIPAVKVLNKFGVQNMIKLGREMGITTWEDEKRFGLSLTLGGGEVKMLDLARAYATIANYGKRPETWSISEIKDSDEKVTFNKNCNNSKDTSLSQINVPCNDKQVLDSRVAFLLTNILNDNTARSPAFGTYSALNIPKHPEIAVKTGTSNDLRDNITIGYNQDYVVAVWVGNNNNSEMSRIASGITGAAPIWNKIMQGLLKDKESIAWTPPEGVKLVNCSSKGEWFLEENIPINNCANDKLAGKDWKRIKTPKEYRELIEQVLE